MQQGSQAMAKRMELMRYNMPKYMVSWVCEAVAFWIFVIICIDSVWGFNWWLADKPHRFGIINIVYLVKNVALIVLIPVMHKRISNYISEIKFPWIDLVYFVLQIVFWLVSTIYAFDREITTEHVRDANWLKRYNDWTANIYILPVVKLCIDFVLVILATFMMPMSHTALSGSGIVWMDLQYLFVYLFITGKVQWDNYFIVFVWIYMGSILATLAALCILCFLVMAIVKRQPLNLIQYLMFISIAFMIILFFVWENIIGSKDYTKNNIYLLLVSIILYTIYNGLQSFALFKGLQIVPQQG